MGFGAGLTPQCFSEYQGMGSAHHSTENRACSLSTSSGSLHPASAFLAPARREGGGGGGAGTAGALCHAVASRWIVVIVWGERRALWVATAGEEVQPFEAFGMALDLKVKMTALRANILSDMLPKMASFDWSPPALPPSSLSYFTMASVTARLPCVLASSTRARAPRSGRSAPTSAPTSGARHAALPLSFSAANARRGVRCNLSMDEGDDTTSKTLSSLDALLQGSQDEPEYDGPDTVRARRNMHHGGSSAARACFTAYTPGVVQTRAASKPQPRVADWDWIRPSCPPGLT
jgi:hypothetical protein